MEQIAEHKILLSGESLGHCRKQVVNYFNRTTLVTYDFVQVIEDKSSSGLDVTFLEDISRAEELNRAETRRLIEELKENDILSIDSLLHIHQGYESKLLHILSHMLDGFIGIDSRFFNLIDDSHWLTEKTASAIGKNPKHFWLLHLDCFAAIRTGAGLLHF